MKFLILVLLILGQLATAQTECKTDADCKSSGADLTCQPQKTGCPGAESYSTCVIHVCRKPIAPAPAVAAVTAPPKPQLEEQKDFAWIKKNRDKDGCITLAKASDSANPDTCSEKIELQIRPLTVGFLKKSPKNLCCYDWKTFGNR